MVLDILERIGTSLISVGWILLVMCFSKDMIQWVLEHMSPNPIWYCAHERLSIHEPQFGWLELNFENHAFLRQRLEDLCTRCSTNRPVLKEAAKRLLALCFFHL